jgi:hypothetical protein
MGDLISVYDFATKWRVSESIVRGWIKKGLIDYVLVGPRKMQCIRESAALKAIDKHSMPDMPNMNQLKVSHERSQLASHIATNNGISIEKATALVAKMLPDKVSEMLLDFIREEQDGQS